jgi:hypothetical protein
MKMESPHSFLFGTNTNIGGFLSSLIGANVRLNLLQDDFVI